MTFYNASVVSFIQRFNICKLCIFCHNCFWFQQIIEILYAFCVSKLLVATNSWNDALLLYIPSWIIYECLLKAFPRQVRISRVSSRHKLHFSHVLIVCAPIFIIEQWVVCSTLFCLNFQIRLYNDVDCLLFTL